MSNVFLFNLFGGDGSIGGGFFGYGFGGFNGLVGVFFEVMDQFCKLFEFCLFGGLCMVCGDVCMVVFLFFVECLMYGYQIINEIVECSGGIWKFSVGLVYFMLQLFVDEGLIEVEEQNGWKIYLFIEVGCDVVVKVMEICVLWEFVSKDGNCDNVCFSVLFKVGVDFVVVVVQVGCSGLFEQVQQIIEVFDEVCCRLYLIFVQD